MTDSVSNSDIFNALMDLKGDVGGIKASSDLLVKGLENHATRIGVLEGASQRQRGAVKVWGLVATAAATVVGGAIQLLTNKH